MNRYRVFYAGRPAEAVLLDADQPAEAAYAFFANRPERNSIFVEIDGGLREWNFSIDELAQRNPDVPAILENLAGEKDVIQATLDTQRRMEKAARYDLVAVQRTVCSTSSIAAWRRPLLAT